MEALNKVWESASQEIYAAQASAEAAGGAPGQEAPEGEGKADQDVSDVEYEEVDDKKQAEQGPFDYFSAVRESKDL